MSIRAMAWAWTQQVTSVQRLVLLCLADHADETGKCHPGIGRIQARTSLGDRTIRIAITSLHDAGFIIRNVRKGVGTTYQVHPEGVEVRHVMPDYRPPAKPPKQARMPANPAIKAPPTTNTPAPDAALSPAPHAGPGTLKAAPSPAPHAAEPKKERSKREEERGGANAPPPPIPDSSSPRPQQTPERAAAIAAALAPTPRRARLPNQRRTKLPLDWIPGQLEAAHARKCGLDPHTVGERFRLHYEATGYCRANWFAAWQLWCDTDMQRAKQQAIRMTARPTKPNRMDEQHREMMGLLGVKLDAEDTFAGVTLNAREAR